MRKLFFILLTISSVASVSWVVSDKTDEKLSREEKKAVNQEKVKKAVESRKFAIKLDRLYLTRYGAINLIPESNYIIINGREAAVSAGYAGRQRGLYPIKGINLKGEPSVFKLQNNKSRGTYKIEMEVAGGNDTFHITMTISENGHCSALISGLKIDDSRYSGILIPIEQEKKIPEPDAIKI